MNYQEISDILNLIVVSLREILSSVKEEQILIVEHNLDKINLLVAGRLDTLIIYEENIHQLVFHLSSTLKTDLVYADQFDLLNILSKIIPVDELSLDLLIQQAKALIQEIHSQNTITSAYLQQEPLHLESRKPKNSLRVADHEYKPKKKAIALKLLEEDEIAEDD